MKITNEKIVYKNFLVVEEGTIEVEKKAYSRERLKRQDASTVLVLNTDTQKIILTRQFRYAIHQKTKHYILEIVAGKIDGDDSPQDTAIRETQEEIGYRVHKDNLKLLTAFFPSPGYTSEKMYVYYATVTNADKVSQGGGLKEENEQIEIVELDVEVFKDMIRKGEFEDGKTYVAGLYFVLDQRVL